MFLKCKRAWLSAMAFVVMFVVSMEVLADVPLRRPISPERPLWIVHIDTWNTPDPERIIEMVPEDIRPYVVFSLSLSATDATCHDGFAVCDSWLKACAQKRVWSMVQCASDTAVFPTMTFRCMRIISVNIPISSVGTLQNSSGDSERRERHPFWNAFRCSVTF